MKRYAILFAVVVVVAAFGLVATRPDPDTPAGSAGPVSAPAITLSLGITGGALVPATLQVPVGSRVRITIENHDSARVELALTGYEDRLHVPSIAPGERWAGEFDAALPGDDFTWTLDGRPAGILRVTGSHLVEGHR